MIPLDKLAPWRADRDAPSPNYNTRASKVLHGVVLHATADAGSEAGTVSWLRSPKAKASAHLLIHRDGTVTRLVEDRHRAWHAGVASWRGSGDVNTRTLGWEIANRNDGKEPYTDAQYSALAHLAAHYIRQGLAITDFVSHAEIAPGRKTDPLGFDWARFISGTVAILSPPLPAPRPPHLAVPAPDPARDMVLEPITVPTAEHVEEAARRLQLPEGALCDAALVVEALMRAVSAGARDPARQVLAAELTGAFGAIRARRCG